MINNSLRDENLVGRCHYDLFPDLPEHWKDEHKRCLAGEFIKNEDEPLNIYLPVSGKEAVTD